MALNGAQWRVAEPAFLEGTGAVNFVNPGLLLVVVGADTGASSPQSQLIGDVWWLSFGNTMCWSPAPSLPAISGFIVDMSAAVQYQPVHDPERGVATPSCPHPATRPAGSCIHVQATRAAVLANLC